MGGAAWDWTPSFATGSNVLQPSLPESAVCPGPSSAWAPVPLGTGVRNGGTTPPCAMADAGSMPARPIRETKRNNSWARPAKEETREGCGKGLQYGIVPLYRTNVQMSRKEGGQKGRGIGAKDRIQYYNPRIQVGRLDQCSLAAASWPRPFEGGRRESFWG